MQMCRSTQLAGSAAAIGRSRLNVPGVSQAVHCCTRRLTLNSRSGGLRWVRRVAASGGSVWRREALLLHVARMSRLRWGGLRRRAVPVMHVHLLLGDVHLPHSPDRHQGPASLMTPFEQLQGAHDLLLCRFPQGQEVFPQATVGLTRCSCSRSSSESIPRGLTRSLPASPGVKVIPNVWHLLRMSRTFTAKSPRIRVQLQETPQGGEGASRLSLDSFEHSNASPFLHAVPTLMSRSKDSFGAGVRIEPFERSSPFPIVATMSSAGGNPCVTSGSGAPLARLVG
jgi:hypothetical protein